MSASHREYGARVVRWRYTYGPCFNRATASAPIRAHYEAFRRCISRSLAGDRVALDRFRALPLLLRIGTWLRIETTPTSRADVVKPLATFSS